MIARRSLYKILTYTIAMIWLMNGLFCKVLNMVPRHEQIVARILGTSHAGAITKVIGLSEILMAVWIISSFKRRINALIQILVIAAMNILEFFLANDLLLFGSGNLILAGFLILVIFYKEFILTKSFPKAS
jgi:hypothetical protein